MTVTPSEATDVDVIIIGAGFSGLGAAHRITERNPGTSYVILERREQIGGTWDLFRYPGVRSDSSIFTLCFPWEPWTGPERVADGEHIREYLNATAHKYGIDQHIRFNTHVRSADWNSSDDTWTVTAEQDGTEKTYRGRFLFFGSGYYNYDEGYTPDFPGLNEFDGSIVHPQHWPEDLDYQGKKVVVIGSGATAMSLIPSLAEKAFEGDHAAAFAHLSVLGGRNTSAADKFAAKSIAAQDLPLDRPADECAAGGRDLVLGPQDAGLREVAGSARSRCATCPRATTSTPTSSRATTHGTSGCA